MIPTQHFRLKTRGLKVPVKHLADADSLLIEKISDEEIVPQIEA
jgi:hypothetical protein